MIELVVVKFKHLFWILNSELLAFEKVIFKNKIFQNYFSATFFWRVLNVWSIFNEMHRAKRGTYLHVYFIFLELILWSFRQCNRFSFHCSSFTFIRVRHGSIRLYLWLAIMCHTLASAYDFIMHELHTNLYCKCIEFTLFNYERMNWIY